MFQLVLPMFQFVLLMFQIVLLMFQFVLLNDSPFGVHLWYLGAILYSLYAKNIIEAYRDIDNVNRDEIKKLHEEINKVFWEVTPAIRLYSSTLTFQSFRRITRIAKTSTFKTIPDESNLKAMDSEVDIFVGLIKKDLGIKE